MRELVDRDREDHEDPGHEILVDDLDAPISVRPFRKTPTIIAPTGVPITVPRPPNRLVPPRTTAVMASRFSVV